jgi:23S rRNA (cytidine1920-2'-O)/16S rRNA (cytidine1409-2'-O)-methyltransferase
MELLQYLLSCGLTADERSARGLLLAGRVLVNDRSETSAKYKVQPADSVRVKGAQHGRVSRGAAKLEPVLDSAGLEVSGMNCLDLGASTGGFTQLLLERGARKVYAVDVGYGLLAEPLRQDPRVVVLERQNARLLSSHEVPEAIDLVLGDMSFISWAAVLPNIIPLLAPAAQLLLLVKPQFELAALGRGSELRGGVASAAGQAREVLMHLYNVWVGQGLIVVGIYPAGLRGAKGNQEYFVHLKTGATGSAPDLAHGQYSEMVEQAVSSAGAQQ